MRVTILGRRWNLRFASLKKNWGDCDQAHVTNKEIRIDSGHKDDRELLDTILHECLHAGLQDYREETVGHLASDLTRVLWRLGWRRTET